MLVKVDGIKCIAFRAISTGLSHNRDHQKSSVTQDHEAFGKTLKKELTN